MAKARTLQIKQHPGCRYFLGFHSENVPSGYSGSASEQVWPWQTEPSTEFVSDTEELNKSLKHLLGVSNVAWIARVPETEDLKSDIETLRKLLFSNWVVTSEYVGASNSQVDLYWRWMTVEERICNVLGKSSCP